MKRHILIMIVFFCSFIISCSDWVELPKVEGTNYTISIGSISKTDIPLNISCFYVSEQTSGLMVAGTKEGKIYYSKNNGASWELKGDIGAKINCLSDFQHDNRGRLVIWAGADNGLWESPSSGTQWTSLIAPNAETGTPVKINSIKIYYKKMANGIKLSNSACYGSDGKNNSFQATADGAGWTRTKLFANSILSSGEILFSAHIDWNEGADVWFYCSEKDTICEIYQTGINNPIATIKAKIFCVDKSIEPSPGINFSASDGVYNLYLINTNILFGKIFSQVTTAKAVLYTKDQNLFTVMNNDIYGSFENKNIIFPFVDGNPNIVDIVEYENNIGVITTEGKMYSFSFSSDNAVSIEPIEPAENAKVPSTVTLKWFGYSFPDADKTTFQIQVSEYSNFSAKIVDQRNYTGFSYNISGLKSGIKYYWRIRVDKFDRIYPWVSSSFTVD